MNDSPDSHWVALAALVGLLLVSGNSGYCQEADAAAEPSAVMAQFVTLTSPVDDVLFGKVKNAALELQSAAVREQQRAILILEITPGTSQFHQVHGLADFLTSASLSKVTTVAWVPETVTGNNVVLALACKEIIMHPDAKLGDVGRGEALDASDQQLILSFVRKRLNKKLSPALVTGMMDPQAIVLKIERQVGPPGKETVESDVVTMAELKRLQETKAVIRKSDTVKEAGTAGLFSGREARNLDLLVVQTADSRAGIAELYDLPRETLREDATSGEPRRVRLIKIDDIIEPVLEAFVERQIERAVADDANLIIFEINSPGGFLLQSTNLANAINSLDPKEVRTVAYIPKDKQALSGAAIIALGCDDIYMHPTATTGDAGPVEIREGGQFERAPEKVLGVLRESLRELAESKHRPAALAMAMADKDLEVFEVTHRDTGRIWYMTDDEIHNSNGEWQKGNLVPESRADSLLTVNGTRAHELKLAEPPVHGWDDLKQRLGIPPQVEPAAVGRTWVDTLIFALNTSLAAFLLVAIGIACIYLEVHLMSGLLSILAAVCFSLFFWSRWGGTAGWLELVLFALGVICIGLEIFVIPGFGVFGVSGGLLVLSALVLASQTFGDIGGADSDFERLSETLGTMGASLVAVVVMAMFLSKYLPSIPLLNQMILLPPGSAPVESVVPQLRPEHGSPTGGEIGPSLVGQHGVARTILRPAGKVQIAGHFVNVVSDGPYIEQGTKVEVVKVTGNHVVVRKA